MRLRMIMFLLIGGIFLRIAALPQLAAASGCGTYRISYGDTLYRIATRHNVSLSALAAANGIYNFNYIYAGQVLAIPCAVQGYVPPQTIYYPANPYYSAYNRPYYPSYQQQYLYYPFQQPYTPPAQYPGYGYGSYGHSQLDCSGFRATSPVEGFPNGQVTFYWDPPRANNQIARYQVRIINDQGREIAAYETLNISTNLSADVSQGSIGPGINFSYYVVGVTADNRLCQTSKVALPREWPN